MFHDLLLSEAVPPMDGQLPFSGAHELSLTKVPEDEDATQMVNIAFEKSNLIMEEWLKHEGDVPPEESKSLAGNAAMPARTPLPRNSEPIQSDEDKRVQAFDASGVSAASKATQPGGEEETKSQPVAVTAATPDIEQDNSGRTAAT